MSHEAPCVFVVDDDVSVREALQNLLRSVGLKVETFGTAEDFLSCKKSYSHGCVVLDVRMPGLSGLDLQRQLAESGREIPIVFITAHGDIPMSVQAVKRGAVEFLTKPFRDQDLLDAVRRAVKLDCEARKRGAEIAELRERYESLTSREQEVMGFVVLGLVNKQIAAKMSISEPTVKLHRGRMMHKMGAESLADLIRIAQKVGALEKP
jgi:FixJ family two-component response regulator